MAHRLPGSLTDWLTGFILAMVIVAQLVSAVKRSLSRALVIVVSVGFGLVKPRLGPTLHKLLAVCFIFFILSAVEGTIKALKVRANHAPAMEGHWRIGTGEGSQSHWSREGYSQSCIVTSRRGFSS